jgi:hypothetical protein
VWLREKKREAKQTISVQKMTESDLKIYLINSVALALNFAEIELGLKIVLTITAIGYTASKWWLMVKNKKKQK